MTPQTTWVIVPRQESPQIKQPKRVIQSFESGKKPLFDLVRINPGISSKEAMERLGWTRGRFDGVLCHFKDEIYSGGLVLKSEVNHDA